MPESTEGPYREYANNCYFDSSVWDLTIIFGQLGTRTSDDQMPSIDWHTAMTLPWPQVKIVAYFLLANLAMHEEENGPVVVPQKIAPLLPDLKDIPSEKLKAMEGNLRALHAQFFGPKSSV